MSHIVDYGFHQNIAEPERAWNLFGADQRGHDAHVRREEELQTHDEDGEDSERHQL